MQKSEKNRSEEKNENKESRLKKFGERIKERLAEKDEREVRERLQRFVGFMLTVLATVFLSRAQLFFGTFPLCLGLICSERRYLPGIGLGILIACFAGLPQYYIYTCLILLMIRILAVLLPVIFSETATEKSRELIKFKSDAVGEAFVCPKEEKDLIGMCLKKIFCEEMHSRALTAAFGGAIAGLFILIENDFSFYSLCATAILTVTAPIAVIAFGGVFGEGKYAKDFYRTLSIGAILFLSLLGAKDGTILGMHTLPFLAMLFTLYVSSCKGLVYGILTAVFCGLAFDVRYLTLLILSALIFCVVAAVKKNAGVAAVCAAVVVWCYYVGGAAGLVEVLPPMLLALPVYMLADKYREMMQAPYRRSGEADGLYFATAVTEKTKNEAVRERLSALSDTFESLSETIYKLSDRFLRPDLLGIRSITDETFASVCNGCRNKDRCWGAEYSRSLDTVKRINSSLHTKGSVSKNELSESFVLECIRCDRLIEEINSAVSKTTERIIKGGKANFFASNYDDITSILKDALTSDGAEYECDVETGGKICDYLYSQGISVGGVAVYGKRCRHVVAKDVVLQKEISAEKNREIGERISEIVGSEMTEPVIEVGKDGGVFLLSSRPKIRASCAHGRISRAFAVKTEDEEDGEILVDPFDGDEVCGDMTDAFITDNSYFYSLISDGMGSGPQAAYTSSVSAMFIEKMLSAGNRADITLRMLNNVIRSENMGCGDECSATVDLLELDLMSGTAAFIKSGAAPTYIAREGTVYKISSRTMPVGIIKDADARITRFDTKKGDVIVMMSDGCCHDSEDCPWLVEYLCAYMTRGKKATQSAEALCQTLKDEIMREALKNAPEGEERDDISVSVVVVG